MTFIDYLNEFILIDCTRLEYRKMSENEKTGFLFDRFKQLTNEQKLKALQAIENEIVSQLD